MRLARESYISLAAITPYSSTHLCYADWLDLENCKNIFSPFCIDQIIGIRNALLYWFKTDYSQLKFTRYSLDLMFQELRPKE
jgi:hypothetical protein